ncbi:MAG: tetratricopeptide repeat protein [Bacteroidales bacterium]|nr:tetratricopeptide repeat protein [Bacteroidales bacterium]
MKVFVAVLFTLLFITAIKSAVPAIQTGSVENIPHGGDSSTSLQVKVSIIFDSLVRQTSTLPDREKVAALLDYSRNFSLSNPSVSLLLSEEALHIARRTDDPLLISNALNGLAIPNYYLGKNEVALSYMTEAVAYLRQAINNDPTNHLLLKRLQSMCSNAGNIYQNIGELEKALEMHLNALRIVDTLAILQPDNPGNLPSRVTTINNIAVLYWYLKQTNKAKALLNEALALSRSASQPEILVITLNNIGLIQIDETAYHEALTTYLEALEIGKSLNDSIGIGGIYNNLGLIYERLGEQQQSLNYYLKSLRISLRLGYTIGIANTCANLGKIYMDKGMPDSAIHFSEKGIEASKSSGLKTYLLKNYETLVKVYEKLGDYPKAFDLFSDYVSLKDSIFTEEKSKQIADMETRYESEKKEQENQWLRQSITFQKRTKLLLFVSITALIIMVIFLSYFYRLKNKTLKQKTTLYEQETKLRALEHARLEDQLFAEQEINRLQNEKLDQKNRELSSRILHVLNKNDIMNRILEEVDQMKSENPQGVEQCFSKINKLVSENIHLDGEWEQFKLHFDEVNPGFFAQLQANFQDLTAAELKLCAYYRINLDTKEIARMLSVTPAGVQKSRHRLRKKMNIPSDMEMHEFLNRF